MANEIERLAPPALPTSQNHYSPAMMETHSNILRLFFTRLTGVLGALLNTEVGGRFLYFPYGEFYDTSTQTAALANTAYNANFGTTRGASTDISIASSSRITVSYEGCYHIRFSGNAATTSSTTDDLLIWVKKNGTNVANTTRSYRIAADTGVDYSCVLELAVDDYVEIAWEVSSTDIRFAAVAAGSNDSGIPAVSVAVTYAGNC